MKELDIGDTIGVYRTVRILGKGAMGAVYEVVHTQLGVHYALKSFTFEGGHFDVLKDKFLAEGRVLARHPHLRILFPHFFFMSLQLVGQSVFTGLGKARHAVFFSLFRKVVIETPLMLLLPAAGLGAAGVFWSEPVSDVIGGLAAYITMLVTVYFPLRRELRAAEAGDRLPG